MFLCGCSSNDITYIPTYEEKVIEITPPYVSVTYNTYQLSVNNIGELYRCDVKCYINNDYYKDTIQEYLSYIKDTLKLKTDSLKWGHYYLKIRINHSTGEIIINTNFSNS